MRRVIVLVLMCVLGFGALAACGKKSPPRLPSGEELRVQQKGGGTESVGVTPAKEDKNQQDLDKPEYEEAPSDLPPGGKTPPASSVDDSGVNVAPEQGLPPSPGGPHEPGF